MKPQLWRRLHSPQTNGALAMTSHSSSSKPTQTSLHLTRAQSLQCASVQPPQMPVRLHSLLSAHLLKSARDFGTQRVLFCLTSLETVEALTPTALAMAERLSPASRPCWILILSFMSMCLFFPLGMISSFSRARGGEIVRHT